METWINAACGLRWVTIQGQRWGSKDLPLPDRLAAYQLVGGVTAHQGYDGYLVLEDDQAHWD